MCNFNFDKKWNYEEEKEPFNYEKNDSNKLFLFLFETEMYYDFLKVVSTLSQVTATTKTKQETP